MKETARLMRSPGMGLATLAVVAVLLGLGFWQLQRKEEKHALIATLTARQSAIPVELPPVSAWNILTADHDEFLRVTFRARFDGKSDASVFASGSALRSDISGVGVWNFVPVQLASGETVVVNRGFVPDGVNFKTELNQESIIFTGTLRFPEKTGWFTPHQDLGKRLWFVRDHFSMAQALGWGHVAPFYVDLEAPVPAGRLPLPGPLDVHLRDQHLQYAITWFALAVVVTIAFGFWLVGQRRL